MAKAARRDGRFGRALSGRAVAIGATIIGAVAYLCPIIEQYEWEIDYVLPAPPVSVMFFFLILILGNALLARWRPNSALSSNELLLIYAMTMVGAPLCSFGLVQFLLPNMVGPVHFATPENMWADEFLRYIPDWFGPRDPGVIEAFYTGNRERIPWGAWAKPLLLWLSFAMALYWVLLCLCAIVRRQWVDHERLTFGVLAAPLAMAQDPPAGRSLNAFFASRWMWVGFCIPVLVQLSVGLHLHVPTVPSLKLMHFPVETYLGEKPWNAITYLHISVMYSIIGIAYMVPADVSFSLWFFYLLRKAQDVLAVSMGWRASHAGGVLARFPAVNDQGVGAFFALFFVNLWMMRRHLRNAVGAIGARRVDPAADDSREAMSYSVAVLGALAGTTFLVVWMTAAGLAPGYGLLFLGILFVFQTVLARIRAESGMAWLFLPQPPSNVIATVVGATRPGVRNLTILASLKFHTFEQNGYIMPFQMEALKAADGRRIRGRDLTTVILVGMALYIGVGTYSSLRLYYAHGADSMNQWRVESGAWAFEELQAWLASRPEASLPAILYMGLGAAFYGALSIARNHWLWWPFHPIGYAVANTFTMEYLWSPFLMGWLAKFVALRVGGMAAYRRLVPFFLGLIVGEAAGNGFWSTVLGEVFGIHGFAHFEF
ncbi:hypothetical protein CMK11_00210 [Candidatus Poribacteria bacterium]|nr:hypothetical protein [Candidatus Poribacteria bacterium]